MPVSDLVHLTHFLLSPIHHSAKMRLWFLLCTMMQCSYYFPRSHVVAIPKRQQPQNLPSLLPPTPHQLLVLLRESKHLESINKIKYFLILTVSELHLLLRSMFAQFQLFSQAFQIIPHDLSSCLQA